MGASALIPICRSDRQVVPHWWNCYCRGYSSLLFAPGMSPAEAGSRGHRSLRQNEEILHESTGTATLFSVTHSAARSK